MYMIHYLVGKRIILVTSYKIYTITNQVKLSDETVIVSIVLNSEHGRSETDFTHLEDQIGSRTTTGRLNRRFHTWHFAGRRRRLQTWRLTIRRLQTWRLTGGQAWHFTGRRRRFQTWHFTGRNGRL